VGGGCSDEQPEEPIRAAKKSVRKMRARYARNDTVQRMGMGREQPSAGTQEGRRLGAPALTRLGRCPDAREEDESTGTVQREVCW
jgi:hypothetical protein